MERTSPAPIDRKKLITGGVVTLGVAALLAWIYRGRAELIPPTGAPPAPPTTVAAAGPVGSAPGAGPLAVDSRGGGGGRASDGTAATAASDPGSSEAAGGAGGGAAGSDPAVHVPGVAMPNLGDGPRAPGASRINARGLGPAAGRAAADEGEQGRDPNFRVNAPGRVNGADVSLRHTPRRGPHDSQLAGYSADPLRNGRRGFSGPGTADAALVARRARAEVDQWARNYCYRRALIADPGLTGRVEIGITIDTTGHISRATAEPAMNRSLAPAAEFGACIERNLRGRVLPAPQGGEVQFHFALGLEPGGR